MTSGLAFVPGAFAPVYCATKAALHSLSVSMRHDLQRKSIEVIENETERNRYFTASEAKEFGLVDDVLAKMSAEKKPCERGWKKQNERRSASPAVNGRGLSESKDRKRPAPIPDS